MDDTVHAIDTLRWACGGEVAEVRSACRRIGVPDINLISAELAFDNGSAGLADQQLDQRQARVPLADARRRASAPSWSTRSAARCMPTATPQGEWFDTRAVAGSDALHVYGGF